MKFFHKIGEGEIIPAWYGLAWREMSSYGAMCMPIPFNIIAAMLRSIYIFLKYGYKPVPQNPRDAYHQGIEDAKK